MTFATASVSACEVDDVAANTGAATCFRAARGTAACCRAAGWMTAAGTAASDDAGGVSRTAAATIFGAALRAIGRGFGNGTFGEAAKQSTANADTPAIRASAVPVVVHRFAAARPNRAMAVFRCESSKRGRPQLYFIEVIEKLLICRQDSLLCTMTTAKSRLPPSFRRALLAQTRNPEACTCLRIPGFAREQRVRPGMTKVGQVKVRPFAMPSDPV
jgi:hypothetical protein